MEVNLAVFYMRGVYYDLVKRLLGIQHVSPLVFSTWILRQSSFFSSLRTLITHTQDLHHILS